MPGSKFRGHYRELSDIARVFGSSADTTKQTLQDLTSKMGTLQGGDWKGDSANVFYQEMDGAVLPALKRLSSALSEASTITNKISQLVHTTEQESAQIFKPDAGGERDKLGGGIIGGIIGGIVGGIVGGPIGAVAGAAAGAAIGNAATGGSSSSAPAPGGTPVSADQETARKAAVQKFIDAGDKQGAVDEAIKQYGINTGNAKSVKYDSSTSGEGLTKKDGTVTIGDDAFSSPGWLASSIGHEAQHADQAKNGRWDDRPQGPAMNEVEGYDWEIKNAKTNGLSNSEISTLQKRRTSYYNKLSADNKARADAGNYTIP